MVLTIVLAKLIGLLYILVGLGMMISKKYYKDMYENFLKNEGTIFLAGAMSFAFGFIVVSFHNLWVGEWYLLITLLGWAALIKGALFLLLPKFQVSLAKAAMKNELWLNAGSVIALIIGLVLCYFGFIA